MHESNAKKMPMLRVSGPGQLHAPARAGDAGMDLSAYLPDGPIVLRPNQPELIPTGCHIELPEGHLALVTPRSGLALRRAITLMNGPGLIDQGYRGDVSAILVNFGGAPYIVSHGDRIAQLVILRMGEVKVMQVEKLKKSERGEDGFGSTGVTSRPKEGEDD